MSPPVRLAIALFVSALFFGISPASAVPAESEPDSDFGTLCDPCVSDEDCLGLTCSEIPGTGNFCTIHCVNNNECPADLLCYPLNGIGQFGAPEPQCVPATGCAIEPPESTGLTSVPSEGILSFRAPSPSCCPPGGCSHPISILVTDGAGEVVPGTTDETSVDADGFGHVLWEAHKPPLEEGATYTYETLFNGPNREGGATGSDCDREGIFTVREGPFPEMTQPTVTLTDLTGLWVPEFECYVPSYRVEVTKHAEPDLAPYHRYTIFLVLRIEINVDGNNHSWDKASWIKRQAGDGDPTFDHIEDWSTRFGDLPPVSGEPQDNVPYQDSYCIRVEAREIVNQTHTTEDLCITASNIVGAPAGPGAPWTTVSEDAAFCDASVDVTNPIVPSAPPPVQVVTSSKGGSSRDDGCAGGPVNTVLPGFVLALLVFLRRRSRAGATGSP